MSLKPKVALSQDFLLQLAKLPANELFAALQRASENAIATS